MPNSRSNLDVFTETVRPPAFPPAHPRPPAELRLPFSVRSRAVLQLVLPLLPRQMARPVRVLHDALQPFDGLRFRPSSPLPALSSSHRLISTFSSLDWVVLGKVEGNGTDHHGHVTALTVAPEYRRLKLASGLMDRLEASSSSPTHDGYFVRSLSLFLSLSRLSNSQRRLLGLSVRVGLSDQPKSHR